MDRQQVRPQVTPQVRPQVTPQVRPLFTAMMEAVQRNIGYHADERNSFNGQKTRLTNTFRWYYNFDIESDMYSGQISICVQGQNVNGSDAPPWIVCEVEKVSTNNKTSYGTINEIVHIFVELARKRIVRIDGANDITCKDHFMGIFKIGTDVTISLTNSLTNSDDEVILVKEVNSRGNVIYIE